MFKLRWLDKVAYQTTAKALDAFERGDASLLTPLVARCLEQLRSESADPHRLYGPGFNECVATHLEEAMAGGDRTELADTVIALTAMPDYQLTLVGDGKDSPNLVELDWLYPELDVVAPWFNDLVIERFSADCLPYAAGLSMFLFRRDDLVRLQAALHKVVAGPSSPRWLRLSRDRLLDLIGRTLADESTAIALCDYG